MSAPRAALGPVIRLLGVVGSERSLFVRSTLSMTAYQLAAAAASGTSAAIAAAVASGRGADPVVALLIAGLVAAVVAVALFTWIESWLSHVLAYRVIDGLRVRVYDALEAITPARSGRRRAGAVAGTALGDVETLEWFYAHTLGSAINAIVSPTLVGIVLVVLVGPVGLLVPAGVALLLVIPAVLGSLQARQGARIREELGSLRATAFEGAEAQREIHALGLVGHHRAEVLAATGRVHRAKRAFALRAAGESALADVVVAVTTLGFLTALVARVAAGEVDPVLVPAAMVLVGAAIAPAAGAFAMVQRLGEMSAAASRVLDLLDETDPVPPGGDDAPGDGRGELRFEGVGFGYAPGPRVLDGLDLVIRPGESVALVGASGAGKSTIARLLVRFWDPDDGRIVLDGRPLTSVDPVRVRREIALVAQHPFVFRGTVRSNLLIARPDADDDALRGALADAGLAETVESWPLGLDQPIGERGATLSGGQRQRLAIARAFLRDPAVLVLDEASAHLDALRENDLADTIDRVRAGRTTIVIAHRISTIRRSARVVMLGDGRVVADGSHDDLLASEPRYRALLAREDQGERVGAAGARPDLTDEERR
ncbi:ABC transporter ATP-binding protein/permease [Agromyces atrinae]|uniref:ABC transporter ATP-binding protein n=1 Tax=Agromyces atrinae TaxID=592376 RepID=UPI001F566A3F|nr:ABC transporter ATP-binding protein [Agromyces atrinae]MCI2956429.1 ABC transporter ATP-binding protein/permease [Agromyces atrinae]